jgi:hypothetical protein
VDAARAGGVSGGFSRRHSREELERVVAYARAQGDRQQLDVLLHAAQSWADRGNLERAQPIFDECLDLVDQTRGRLDGPERYHLMEKAAAIA